MSANQTNSCHPDAVECASKKGAAAGGTTSSTVAPRAAQTSGDSVAELRARIEALEARVTVLEKAVAAK